MEIGNLIASRFGKFSLALFLGAVLVACGPPLRLHERGTEVEIDVQSLGEYQTSIRRIVVMAEGEASPVWEVVAKDYVPQIHKFTLRKGLNEAPLGSFHEQFQQLHPRVGGFELQANTTYRVEVYGASGKASATFSFR